MPLAFKKVKKKSGDAPLSEAKSADQIDTPPEAEIAEANDKVQLLEKELAECKAELLALKESDGQSNNEEIDSLKQQINEVTTENTDLKKWIKELQTENADMKKVFGSLDDLGELRNQYEKLFEDDFQSSTPDIDSLTNPAAPERGEKTREFCTDMKAFILDVRAKSLGSQ